MDNLCTGCNKPLNQAANVVTIKRYRPTTMQEFVMGKKPKAHTGSGVLKEHYGTVFVGEGLCDSCVGYVMEGVRLLWEKVRQDSIK